MMKVAAPSRSTVSVIVPCFNYGHFLTGCLESVLSQQHVDVQVLVIDDRSTDDSADVARRLAARDDRIEFRRHRENAGLIPTANEGLEWAQGDYVVLLSADDFLVPNCLARATSVMLQHPNVGLVYGRPLIARENRPTPAPRGRWRATKIWSGSDWIHIRCRSGYNCISSPEVVVRNSVQQAVGGYDPACRHTSDLNMWLRIAAVADIGYIRGVPQAIYRVHGGSMLRSVTDPLIHLRERRQAFDSFFARSGTDVDPSKRMQRTVARTLARQALWRASREVDRGGPHAALAAYVNFAVDVYPRCRRLREWYGLQLRKRIGVRHSPVRPAFLLSGAAHRARSVASQTRWRLTGI
jgi:glycosyltransferase involved in cell wall biosynthesis